MANSAFTPTFNVSDASVTEAKLAAGATLKIATEQATTSGTAIDFTGIPSGTKQIIVMWEGVSCTAAVSPYLKIGDSGGIEDTGYVSTYDFRTSAGANLQGNVTAGFLVGTMGNANNVLYGSAVLTLMNAASNKWGCTSYTVGLSTGTAPFGLQQGGTKSLSGVLDRVRIDGGTFDAGSINIAYK